MIKKNLQRFQTNFERLIFEAASKIKLLDFVIIIGLLLFSAILVIGLFPQISSDNDDYFFINVLMAVPIILAIYLIFISFRRRLSQDYRRVETGIRIKIAMAFLLVAVLPTLPVVIMSNKLINRNITQLVSKDTRRALDNAILLAQDQFIAFSDMIQSELVWLEYSSENNILDLSNSNARRHVGEIARLKGLVYLSFDVNGKEQFSNNITLSNVNSASINLAKEVTEYLQIHDFSPGVEVSRVALKDSQVLVGTYYSPPRLEVMYRIVPGNKFSIIEYFMKERGKYTRMTETLPAATSAAGIFLLVLAVAIVIVAIIVSFFLSGSITRPVIELTHAAEHVAKGDLDIKLYRKSNDELSYLFQSFNLMVYQLKENRNDMLQIEKLKAWHDVGRRLLHEIKNPLTPIKLSAERMKRKFIERSPDMEKIITNSTNTIIEEVNSLQHILSEFSNYARLPEVKAELLDINRIILGCINFYDAHEGVHFQFGPGDALPEIYFDKGLIRQALINIFKNSIEAMHNSGEITVVTGVAGDYIHIMIKDSGPGISKEYIDKVFEPTFSKKEGGTGLGLAIVQKIIFEHHGRIRCTNADGGGALFVIELPVTNKFA